MATEPPAMAPRRKYALWLVLLSLLAYGLAALLAGVVWADLQPGEREALAAMAASRGPLLVMLALAVPLAIAVPLRLAFAAYPAVALRLAEQVRIVLGPNPAHQAQPQGAAEMRQLAAAVNQLAGAYGTQQQQVQARIAEAHARLAQEKNQLAALMSELAQSVVVCNREGRVLLYNPRATQLLAPQRDGGEMPLGLGRSIFGVLDRSPVLHAMGQLAARMEQGAAGPVAHFVTTRGEQLLRAQMAPVPDAAGGMAGFVLILEDVTRSVASQSRRDRLLQQLTEGSRSALANIRAAAETLQQYPDMEQPHRLRFLDAIREEAQKLSGRLDTALAVQEDSPPAAWPREDIALADLVAALRRSLPQGPAIAWQEGDAPLWLSVDSYALVQALAQLLQRLALRFGLAQLQLAAQAEGRWVRLALGWQGPGLEPALLHAWEQEALPLASATPKATLRVVLDQHGAEMWCQPAAGGAQRLFLQLPAAQPEQPAQPAQPARGAPPAPGRPVYYDFDLFGQPAQDAQLEEHALAELACTVFDTETTGLSPSDGDEIIAIGAVRVLNGRLLQQESFDRLVRPRRPVRREAQAVHGIGPEMLAGQPMLEEVLPAFHRFAQDTVLVGHNAAFDMRLLQLARERTGLAFDQPVLDTLLLSALVHPGHGDAEHRLEAIAQRLGVPVVGRHTALGDALVTAEIFLKLLPLLASRGIRTLKQAREASRKTLYAKLEY